MIISVNSVVFFKCIFLVNAALVFIGPAACPALLFKLILFNNIKSA